MKKRIGHRRAAVAVEAPAGRTRRRATSERRLFEELESLARLIEAAKRDIAAIRPDEIRQKHLPTATDELDAIVSATADATGAILDSAEKLTTIANETDAKASEQIIEQVTRIFEACTFQDITGQRITKVVRTLKEVETKIGALVDRFGVSLPAAAATKDTRKGEAALLNGPQLPKDAVSQSEVDALFDKA
jgi:chemotaxis protein CheZ